MNVLHVISSPAAGGAEIYVKDLSVGMRNLGINVFILFISHASEINRDNEFEINFLHELSTHGIQYDFIGNSCKRNPLKGIRKLNQIVNFFEPDVIHSHLYYGAVFSLFSKIKNKVYTHHNIDIGANKYIYKILDLGIKKYIGICGACERLLSKLSSNYVVRIDNAVDESRILKKKNKQENESDCKIQLLMVGRLVEQKNFFLAIDAIDNIQNDNFHLNIVGEGELKDDINQYIKKRSLSKKISLLGNRSDIAHLMSQSDIFIMSSAWEGLPIALIEATLTGLPVLVTNVGGCAEVVEQVGNGIVVNNLTTDSYVEALKYLITDAAMRERFHLNAINNSSIYTINYAVKKHIELYNLDM